MPRIIRITNHAPMPIIEQMRLLEMEDFNEELCIEFFPEYTESPEPVGRFITPDEQRAYITFLQKNLPRIEKITIYLSINENELPYPFLGECLSVLTNIKRITLNCTADFGMDAYHNFKGLGRALNRLPNFQNLVDLNLDIGYLSALPIDDEDGEEDVNDFIGFMQSCVNLQKFRIDARYMYNEELVNKIIDEVIKYQFLKEARVYLSFVDLPYLGKIFTSQSITELFICPVGQIDTSDVSPAKTQIEAFANKLGIYTNLKKLMLNFKEAEFEGDEDHYSIAAFERFSHNKTLQLFGLHLPVDYKRRFQGEIEIEAEKKKWSQFINNFRNSSLVHLEVSPLVEFNLPITQLIESVTRENKASDKELKSNTESYRQAITCPCKYFKGSFFQFTSPQVLAQLDNRLHRVDLRIAHLDYQKELLPVSSIHYQLYMYFCTILLIKIAPLKPEITINIISYFTQNDLSQLIIMSKKTSRGIILSQLREDINNGFNYNPG